VFPGSKPSTRSGAFESDLGVHHINTCIQLGAGPQLSRRFARLGQPQMTSKDEQPIFCRNIGTATPDCCYASDQNSPTCRSIFSSEPSVFDDVCDNNTCLEHCSDPGYIFGSILDREAWTGSGVRPIHRYRTCANVPNLAGYLDQNLLNPTILSQVDGHLSQNASRDALKNVKCERC
jgi:hypothetical protein